MQRGLSKIHSTQQLASFSASLFDSAPLLLHSFSKISHLSIPPPRAISLVFLLWEQLVFPTRIFLFPPQVFKLPFSNPPGVDSSLLRLFVTITIASLLELNISFLRIALNNPLWTADLLQCMLCNDHIVRMICSIHYDVSNLLIQ